MSDESRFLDISLLGKEYRVACSPSERAALQAAVALVDAKMHEIAEKTKSNIAERIAVMAALNIAHEFLSFRDEQANSATSAEGAEAANSALDLAEARRRITEMEAQLDGVLGPQDRLL
ncbi:cell division protein ZapA [Rhodocyclus tenuis]|uniref:cell division protein ZapA n=1 Tax=Rhodocyclus gracilis TaxID=2929842 RepID=UPI001298D584|nr:cell division protein ZapA [Rhodocyclus gracilis]MRD72160.1 cell division protein ZapA [Rhodocyclus gracilis]